MKKEKSPQVPVLEKPGASTWDIKCLNLRGKETGRCQDPPVHPGIEKCFQKSQNILQLFLGGIWGCFLASQFPPGGVKTLGHTWEESRVDSRAKIYLQRRNNKMDTFPGRLWACGYEFRSQNERSEDFRRILGGISAQIQDNTVSARGEKLPEANHGQGHLQPGLAAQSPIQCGSGSLQG